jgi:hypothetical protein
MSSKNSPSCTAMIITALFTIAKLWSQPRCQSIKEWIKKMWHIYTMECYSTIKNEIILFAGQWMELENIMLNKEAKLRKTNITSLHIRRI